MAMVNRDDAWQAALRDLQRLIEQYEAAKGRDDQEAINVLEPKIAAAMRRLSEGHPDPRVREYWKTRAENFAGGDKKEKEHILADVGKGLLILLATPFVLVGGVLFAAGGIIYGVGSVVKGLGNLLTGGMFG